MNRSFLHSVAALVACLFAASCSRESNAPVAAPAESSAEIVPPAELDSAAVAEARPIANPEQDLAHRLARLAHQAEEHESRNYFDQAVAVRREMVELLSERSGADSWETRSAQVALDHTIQLKDLDSDRRATNDQAIDRQRAAFQAWQQRQPQQALAAIVAARSLAAEVWGEDSYGVAALADQEARWRLSLGDRAAAESLLRQALTKREKVFSPTHPDSLSTASALGLLMQAEGRYDEAEQMMRDGAEQARRLWGDTNLEYGTQLNNLGMLLDERGKLPEAIEMLSHSLQIRRHVLGDNHPTVGDGLMNLGKVHYASHDYAEAGPIFAEAVRIFEPALGADHHMTRTARVNCALSRLAERRFDEAEALLRTDLESTRRACGEKSAAYAENLLRIAIVYGNQGRFAAALPLADQAAACFEGLGGDKDHRTVQAWQLANRLRTRANQTAAADSGSVQRTQAVVPAEGSQPISNATQPLPRP